MTTKKWIFSGIYISAGVLGWVIAFAGSQYIVRMLTVDGLESIEIPNVESTSNSTSVVNKNRSSSKSSYTSIINKRNIFDSSAAQKAPTPKLSPTGEEMTISDIDAQLMGTIVMKPEKESLAMIQIRSNGSIIPYGVGDSLLDAKVEIIEPEYVWLRRNDQLEVLPLHGEKKATGKKGTKKDKKASDDSGISKAGKDKYTVDQAIFDELLQNPEKLYTQIRATEHKKDGEVDGYRVSGIRRKSVFYKLGIKNGDVIHNVNGMPLTNLSEAMKAFESLQSSRDFNFDITRRRKKRTMEYEVR